MPLRERLARTREWLEREAAQALPERIRYWATISFLVQRVRDDEVVPEILMLDILGRPRRVDL